MSRVGRASVFASAQNRALRSLLVKAMKQHGSQQALAELLGIKQQNVGRLLRDGRAGFSYATAGALVRLEGWSGIDAFFEAKGLVTVEPKSTGTDG